MIGTHDIRETLINDRATGPASRIQLPAEAITRLHGILIDVDPKFLKPDNPWFRPDGDAEQFYANVRGALERHPLARHAEVRASGTGLHLLLWLRPPVELASAAQQERWQYLVRVMQRSLPSDPTGPGITALTRPVGATNSKNGATVRQLKAGQAIPAAQVEAFAERVARAPFREVALPLLGTERVSPCPVCRRAECSLAVLDTVGQCYGGCGKVPLHKLLDVIFIKKKEKASQEDAATEAVAC